jgi:hypothetical protein
MRILRNYWRECAIVLILFILVAFPCLLGLDSGSVNNAILALTATIVLWYTHETKRMKIEIAKQNLLQTRPILTVELRDQKAFVKNQGKGPALNSCITNFSVCSALRGGAESTEEGYSFNLPSFLALDSEQELVMLRKNANSSGTVSEPVIFFEIGRTTRITIQYEDIEGTLYETGMEIRSGITQKISIVKRAAVA